MVFEWDFYIDTKYKTTSIQESHFFHRSGPNLSGPGGRAPVVAVVGARTAGARPKCGSDGRRGADV